MQVDAGISEVNVVTFSGGAALPSRNGGARPASEFIGSALSRSERLSGPDPSKDAEAG